MNSIQVGSVVLSTQGRDKGMYFVVVATDDKAVYLADGGMRRLASPKRKNPKHLSDSGVKLDAIATKLTDGKKVFDSEVKSALRQFSQNQQEKQDV